MPQSGPPASRGHLRLAPLPTAPARRDAKILLLARAFAATLTLLLATVVAWASAAVAIAPLLWRRAPLGGRLRPLRAPDARVIPFPSRRPQEQQQALPR